MLAPTMKKATPLITVEEIEPCLAFWTEGLGFEVTASVPQGDKMGFATGEISISIGVAEYDPAAPPDGPLLEVADKALYLAKAAGRNTIA